MSLGQHAVEVQNLPKQVSTDLQSQPGSNSIEKQSQTSAEKTYFKAMPKLLLILQLGGATGDLFTAEQIVSYVGKYIDSRKLYDPQNKRLIHCKNDLLGEVFQLDEFIVSDFRNLWKRVSPYLYLVPKVDVPSTSQSQNMECGASGERELNLPWWYYAKLPKLETTNASETTGRRTYDCGETVGIQDSEYEDSEVEFLGEFEPVDTDDTDSTVPVSPIYNSGDDDDDDDDLLSQSEIESLKQFQTQESSDGESSTDFSIDTDIALEEYWGCHECRTKNPPTTSYCQRCWTFRRGWVSNQTTLKRAITDPIRTSANTTCNLVRSASLDVTDGRKKDEGEGEKASRTIKPLVPSFSSAGKHKLDDEAGGGNPASNPTELKKRKVEDGDESLVSSPMSKNALTSNASAIGSDIIHSVGLCNICRSAENNAIFCHRNTAHQFCCIRCAKKLQRRGKPCPVCRQPIALVMRNYVIQM